MLQVIIFFILGLAVGSFLNVVVVRQKNGTTLLGRSFCPQCNHQIRFYDNIPFISFFILGGKCRDCKKLISWQYPLTEIVTALLFSLNAYYFYPDNTFSSWAYFICFLALQSLFIAVALYDAKYMEIPLVFLLAGGILIGGMILLDVSLVWPPNNELVMSLLGGLSVLVFFLSLVVFSKETWMGWGDVWVGAMAGFLVGLSSLLIMLTLSFGVGAFVSLFLMFFRGQGMKSQIPFAPFLVVGALMTLFLPKMFPFLTNILLF